MVDEVEIPPAAWTNRYLGGWQDVAALYYNGDYILLPSGAGPPLTRMDW